VSEAEESAIQIDYAERFRDFLRNFRDSNGELKYLQRLRRMINFNQSSLIVDYPDLYRYDTEIAEAAVDDPDRFIRAAGEAIRELVAQEDPQYAERKRRFIPRFVDLFETVKIREIRSEHVGRLVQIDGVITRMLPVKSKLVKAVFLHDKCGGTFTWPPGGEEFSEDKLERPPYCPLCGESGGRFVLVKEKSEYVDYQKIVVQERPEDVPGGQMPRSIEVRLTGDLVDTARPGDRVQIAGVVRLEPTSPKSLLFDLFIDANSIRVSEKELEEVSITREDEERIRQLAMDPWVRERIVASVAPSIYGHWDLKEAIALLLFGGVPKTLSDGTRIRGDIHVLFIGDPGMAKSQLLQAAARIAPRAVYTSGKGSTAAGLTAAVLRDPKTGEWYLEAGALVLADGGVAIIDEIDKMRNEDRTAIHEAMEQQTISISKAGIVARLNARASVLAAGNPKFGLYDPNKSFVDNVNLPPTILSRFDLIFVLRDVPDKRRDAELAAYVLEAHTSSEKIAPEVDPQLLRKYILYARRYIRRVRLSPEAKEMLKDFFTTMRASALAHMQGEGPLPIPITTRQLEALVRLTEAHARMALRDEAGPEDAAEAIRITLSFLTSVGFDVETGVVDVGMLASGATYSMRSVMSIIQDIIKELSQESGSGCARRKQILDAAESRKIPREKAQQALEKMYQSGLIYDRGNNCYALVP